ncbi:hypothetical protein QBC43DRAFT_315449 [Cladorrhinum sp. PSN259]|nr:hypothetical protein QBC43DRAFT_315449 [Cladorrhinum sp. PSN259]
MPTMTQENRTENSNDDRTSGPTPVSLSRRAPTGPIPTRRWHMYFSYGFGSIDYDNTLEQKNHCIRSQLADTAFRSKMHTSKMFGSLSAERSVRNAGFPYPPRFRQLMDSEEACKSPGQTASQETFRDSEVDDDPSIQQRVIKFVIKILSFKIERTSAVEEMVHSQPVYLVVGIFPRGQSNPRERVVFVEDPAYLLWSLRWALFRLRGIRSTFFSLRHVQGLRLYKCDSHQGTHERVELDDNGKADLQLFLHAYSRWFNSSYATRAWAKWIHETLNSSSYDVVEGRYSLELVLDWSVTRISAVIMAPVLLSLAVGLWLNSSNWTDLDTIQTAWGAASYVVTAGSLIAALLAILSGIGINR